MRPERVFQILLASGLVAGGWLYGDYWKKSSRLANQGEGLSELRAANSELTQEIDRLEEELAQVRSILSSGPYPVPDKLISWVEGEHDMVFLKAPDVRLASPTELREAARRNLDFVHGEANLENEGQVWELLGILPPNQRLGTQLLFVNSSGLKGIFDFTNERILLSENFDPVSVPDQSVLVRLLAQQLSFQNHPRKEWTSRDQWQAWEALHTGAAAALQARFLRRNSAANETDWGDPEPQRQALLNDLAPALAGFCNFPFIEGSDYTRFFYLDSREAFAEMFRDPPTSTRQVLHPNQSPLTWQTPPASALPGENIFLSNLGELGLRLWLDPALGNSEAEELASGWVFDQYHLQRDGRSQILVWQVVLENEEKAEALGKIIEQRILPDLREVQPIRSLTLARSGATLTLTNAPIPE